MKSSILLVEARRRANLTQAALAARVGTTQSAIARIERGASVPSLEHLLDLIQACGLDLELSLVPHDDHEWSLVQENRRLTPSQRLDSMLAAANIRSSSTAAGEGTW
jgi:transcriptional regulator with XRE-family HTH domain